MLGLAIAGLIGSLAPIWRSGETRGLNLWQFAYEHSTFSKRRQWVNLEDKRTHEKIWVEIEEGRPKSDFLYQDGWGKVTAYVDPSDWNSSFTQLNDIQGKVRRDGKYYSLKDFITPEEPLIRDLAAILYQGGNFVKDAQDFVHSEIKYKSERGDFWQMPVQTLLEKGTGDCEDTSLLLCSILRNYIAPENVWVIAGEWKGTGHAWLIAGDPDWHVVESTRSSSRPVNEKDYSPAAFFNDEYAWSTPSDFDFLLVANRYAFLVQ